MTKYVRRAGFAVVAVQLALETDGFTYRKWGAIQTCKQGDWLVRNGADTYTVDSESFARTYREVGQGTYVKTAPVWAEKMQTPGSVATKEGRTQYAAGDYLVSNEENGNDAYAISAAKFEAMYECAG